MQVLTRWRGLGKSASTQIKPCVYIPRIKETAFLKQWVLWRLTIQYRSAGSGHNLFRLIGGRNSFSFQEIRTRVCTQTRGLLNLVSLSTWTQPSWSDFAFIRYKLWDEFAGAKESHVWPSFWLVPATSHSTSHSLKVVCTKHWAELDRWVHAPEITLPLRSVSGALIWCSTMPLDNVEIGLFVILDVF